MIGKHAVMQRRIDAIGRRVLEFRRIRLVLPNFGCEIMVPFLRVVGLPGADVQRHHAMLQ